ncbi:MAG: 5-(carboxyamino)imidazole ribonucleotide synthase [Planctomycetaceae bacterium]|nr:5-(carboxyamino)imidazole ribonucleotide synthase [Planctomycetaceae bacterium]
MSGAILPGAAIGVLGSGQLGRMFAIAARKMGYRVHTFSPDSDTPTGQVADVEVQAAYDDLDAVAAFARQVAVVTFEFENVPAATAAAAERFAPVRPAGNVLNVTQHRLREKTYLQSAGFPVTPYRAIRSAAQLQTAIGELGLPAILKTAGWGYDGKGQVKIDSLAQASDAWASLGTDEAVLEAFVPFEREVSVVAARGADRSFVAYPVIENSHRRHILDLSLCPAAIPERLARDAAEMARGVLESLDVVGVLCVEFFVTDDGKLLINELAPRPHNSGHLTIDACIACQFEQQLRSICGLPLGSTELLRPAAMANLLGDLWNSGEPNWPAACAIPGVKLHLYGKLQARPGRKMGHLTALAGDTATARASVIDARESLHRTG